MTMPHSDIEEVLRLEWELQSAATRADPRRSIELLSPDFVEIGASGRRWDRATILDLLAEESGSDTAEIVVHDLHARVLTADVVQVFWVSERDGRRARRTSLWQRTPAGWRQTFHQGTPLP
ncbi:nuclear transport factor 2 family protein [Mobilicoccus pelagius]|uniref:Ribonuclease HI n=1 Tax=Mobilicoccus pelagius NBRC 104925 TaxID=1089455 RepID=H5UUP5_9MICO|nr:nuclear transport factor 2 family protein [Mobilicoccus pelagius]GAB49453.1 ribonuclease HI [Mobilicoccus pelagius NBRC 104925]